MKLSASMPCLAQAQAWPLPLPFAMAMVRVMPCFTIFVIVNLTRRGEYPMGLKRGFRC